MQDKMRLIKNLLALGIIGLLAFFAYRYLLQGEKDDLIIDTTPIHVESIKSIAEITTMSYRDEVVMDSVEYFEGFVNPYDPRDWASIYKRAIQGKVKRRLTIIVKGEVRCGLDLSQDDHVSIHQNSDTIWLTLPKPTILDVIVTPSKTEIFQEQGTWNDNARKIMEVRAKKELRKNTLDLNLIQKAGENATRIFSQMLRTSKKVIIRFD